MLLLSLPLSVLLAIGSLSAWAAVARTLAFDGELLLVITPASAVSCMLLFVVLVIAHELLHAVSLPRAGRGTATTLGFWPQAVTPYVSYQGESSRNRQIAVGLAPFLALSVAPLLAGLCLSVAPGWLVTLSALNAFSSSGDLVGVVLSASRIPSSARVRNQGHQTWWRSPA